MLRVCQDCPSPLSLGWLVVSMAIDQNLNWFMVYKGKGKIDKTFRKWYKTQAVS